MQSVKCDCRHKTYLDAELQQRAVEYGGLAAQPEVGRRNVLPLPHWDKRKSLLLRRLAEREVLFLSRNVLASQRLLVSVVGITAG